MDDPQLTKAAAELSTITASLQQVYASWSSLAAQQGSITLEPNHVDQLADYLRRITAALAGVAALIGCPLMALPPLPQIENEPVPVPPKAGLRVIQGGKEQ